MRMRIEYDRVGTVWYAEGNFEKQTADSIMLSDVDTHTDDIGPIQTHYESLGIGLGKIITVEPLPGEQ